MDLEENDKQSVNLSYVRSLNHAKNFVTDIYTFDKPIVKQIWLRLRAYMKFDFKQNNFANFSNTVHEWCRLVTSYLHDVTSHMVR